MSSWINKTTANKKAEALKVLEKAKEQEKQKKESDGRK
jgi:hypothetical protein